MAKKQDKSLTRKGLWKHFCILIPLAIVMILVTRAHIRAVGGTVEAWVPLSWELDPKLEDVTVEDPQVAEAISLTREDSGIVHVTFRAVGDGETNAALHMGNTTVWWSLSVTDGVIIQGGVNFSGWEYIHICTIVFLMVTVVLFASVLIRLWREAWYGYEMVAAGGGLIFSAFELIFFSALYLAGILRDFNDFTYMITYMADIFTLASVPPMGILALLVSISNVSLILHEGRRPINLLGIAVSVLWAAVVLLWMIRGSVIYQTFNSYIAMGIIDSLIAVAITFGECLLISTMICAWLASRHVPKHGVDYLVVLGCGIRADGTPTPLLAGRVDRALDFDIARTAAGDAPATFVPSGGQGPDEVVSEAQSMGTYLEGKGVEPDRIVLEGKSNTTRENMAFSREVIEKHAGKDASELKVGFCTTNYHVFRGYVCAHQAGMAVEGMGSKTRAYFWPNAFLREFIGLLASQWKMILQTYLFISIIYAFAEYALMFG